MSRDLKPKKNQPARKKARGGTLIGMFIGLVIGVVIAAGVVWTMNKSPLPFNKQVMTQTPPPEGGKVNGVKAVAPAGDAQPPLPITLPGKPGDPIPEKRFQFYDILPGKSNAVGDKAPKAVAREEPKKEEKKEEAKVESKESKTPLFLQAGSFSTPHDADNQKAKLAFMGVEAVVQQVMVQDKTYYRVRVGPYTKSDELNKVRAELARDGIEAQVVKSKE